MAPEFLRNIFSGGKVVVTRDGQWVQPEPNIRKSGRFFRFNREFSGYPLEKLRIFPNPVFPSLTGAVTLVLSGSPVDPWL